MDYSVRTVKEDWSIAPRRSNWARVGRWLLQDPASTFGLVVVVIVAIMAIIPGIIAIHSPDHQYLLLRRQPPSLDHPFGMDALGRDIFSRIVYGARFTMGAGFIAVAIGLIVGVPIGLAAGFSGGVVDGLFNETESMPCYRFPIS